MTEIQNQWREGYEDGWAEQGAFPTSEPTIPPVPSIPAGVLNKNQWAYDEGKSRGRLDRMKSQAGLS